MFSVLQAAEDAPQALASNVSLSDRTVIASQTAAPVPHQELLFMQYTALPDSNGAPSDGQAHSQLLSCIELSPGLLHVSAPRSTEQTYINESYKCETCGRLFRARKTLHRHERTQHHPKQYSCTYPDCGLLVARKDTLVRHINDCHGRSPTYVTCLHCGRQIKKRALQEHLMSFVCRAVRAMNTSSGMVETLRDTSGTGQEAFIIALRMFSLIAVNFNVFVETRSNMSANNLEVEKLKCPRDWHTLHVRVLTLLNRHINDIRQNSSTAIALHLASTFVTVMEAGRGHEMPGRLHAKGAEALGVAAHSFVCGCQNMYWECDNWRKTVSQYLGRALKQARKHLAMSNQATDGHHSKLYEEFALRVVHWWNNRKRQSRPRSEIKNTLKPQAFTLWAVKVSTSHPTDEEHVAPTENRPLSSTFVRQHCQSEKRDQIRPPTYSLALSNAHRTSDGQIRLGCKRSHEDFPFDVDKDDVREDVLSAKGQCSSFSLQGEPGAGKTTLVARYIAEHRKHPPTSLLHEFESVSMTPDTITTDLDTIFVLDYPPQKGCASARGVDSSNPGMVFGLWRPPSRVGM